MSGPEIAGSRSHALHGLLLRFHRIQSDMVFALLCDLVVFCNLVLGPFCGGSES